MPRWRSRRSERQESSMLPVTFAAAIISVSIVANLAFDVGINTLQNWYDTVYEDAFWSKRVKDSPAMRALAVEEAEINRMMGEFFAAHPNPPHNKSVTGSPPPPPLLGGAGRAFSQPPYRAEDW